MKAKFLREPTIGGLKNSVATNLDLYRNGNFDYLSEDRAQHFETEIDVDLEKLGTLREPSDSDNFDAENSQIAFESFEHITPYEAADERLWVMLAHTSLIKYTRARWPIPDDDESAVKHIRTHFFASSQRQLERDNVGSRLWWMGHLCSRSQLPLGSALEVLLYRSDVRANVIERPTTAQSVPVFSAILAKLHESLRGDQRLFERKTFRDLMTFLNGIGGYFLLDAMTQSWIESQIDSFIQSGA